MIVGIVAGDLLSGRVRPGLRPEASSSSSRTPGAVSTLSKGVLELALG